MYSILYLQNADSIRQINIWLHTFAINLTFQVRKECVQKILYTYFNCATESQSHLCMKYLFIFGNRLGFLLVHQSGHTVNQTAEEQLLLLKHLVPWRPFVRSLFCGGDDDLQLHSSPLTEARTVLHIVSSASINFLPNRPRVFRGKNIWRMGQKLKIYLA